ncbi:ABC transporter permease [Virgisporangium ochraceum]|uniref:ABC transporter permease n=1 Tax=Virgisporangium ochraceum TaxID=65505 RepID=UPI0019440D65|nr:ABC transporter permease [Virgisporangium ochraceum]
MARLLSVSRFGLTEFLTLNPPVILLTALLPRAVVQALFFTVLGSVLGGPDGKEFAYVGSAALIIAVLCTDVGEVPMADKWAGTFARIRSGVVHPFAIVAARCWPYPVVATAMATVAMVVVGVVTGRTSTTVALLPWLPVYLLMACTTGAATLAATLLAVGRRADLLATNAVSFGVLLASGVFLPPGRIPVVDAVGTILPVSHGLQAVRNGLEGKPWVDEVIAELCVGAGWTVVAFVVLAIQVRRALRLGIDDFV